MTDKSKASEPSSSPAAREICQCPKCGRSHWGLGFGKPPISIADPIREEMARALERLIADYEDVPDATDADAQAVFADARTALSSHRGRK